MPKCVGILLSLISVPACPSWKVGNVRRCLDMDWGWLNVCVYFFVIVVWLSWPESFWAVRNHGEVYVLHNLTANSPVAARCLACDGRAEAAAFPSSVSSVQADDAWFTSRISERDVMWAAMALKSGVGFKRLVLNLGWATWSCLMGMSALGQHCWVIASLRDRLSALVREGWA